MLPITIYSCPDTSILSRPQRLLRCAVLEAARHGLSTPDLRLEKAPRGKPYFPALPQLQFSVTHSGDCWLVAFGAQPLGLDIQYHDGRDYAPLARRWYHPDEQAYVAARDREAFYEVWSAKESVIKQSGRGLAQTLPDFSVIDAGGRFCSELAGGLRLHRLPCAAGYSLCLCTPEEAPIEQKLLPLA